MQIHKELDQGRAETPPTFPLVICTVKVSIFDFESLNFKILKLSWEIYAIYLQAFNSLTTLGWWFHATVSWYNRSWQKGQVLFPPSTDSSLPLPKQPHQLNSAMTDVHLAVKLFTHLTSGEYFSPGKGRGAEGVSKTEGGAKEVREKSSLCQWAFTFIINWKSSH